MPVEFTVNRNNVVPGTYVDTLHIEDKKIQQVAQGGLLSPKTMKRIDMFFFHTNGSEAQIPAGLLGLIIIAVSSPLVLIAVIGILLEPPQKKVPLPVALAFCFVGLLLISFPFAFISISAWFAAYPLDAATPNAIYFGKYGKVEELIRAGFQPTQKLVEKAAAKGKFLLATLYLDNLPPTPDNIRFQNEKRPQYEEAFQAASNSYHERRRTQFLTDFSKEYSENRNELFSRTEEQLIQWIEEGYFERVSNYLRRNPSFRFTSEGQRRVQETIQR